MCHVHIRSKSCGLDEHSTWCDHHNSFSSQKKVEAPIKTKVVTHEPSPIYTTNYMVTMNHNGKIVVKYVGAYTKKAILRSVWVPKVYPSNPQGPKSFWIPKFKA
jgi:hypothetical protein